MKAPKMWERACPRWRPFRQRCINCHTAIAGKPAPTFDLWCDQNTLPDKDPLWERACPR